MNKKYNKYYIEGNVVYIKLSNCNEYTMINLDKWNEIDYIKEFCWFKDKDKYVRSRIPNKYKDIFQTTTICIHQLICPSVNNLIIDHKDRNKLNNLTNNLRLATYSENNQNKGLQSNNTSETAGVCWDKSRNKWQARINVNNKQIYLGRFNNKEDAIKARIEAEIKYFGRFRCQPNNTNKQNNIKEENNE